MALLYKCPFCGITCKRPHNLKTHLKGTVAYGGHEISGSEVDRIIRNIQRGAATIISDSAAGQNNKYSTPEGMVEQIYQSSAGATKTSTPITLGHLNSLSMLENTNAVRITLQRYAEFLGENGVYLRPTDKGLTVISLEYEKCRSMIGVGDRNSEIVYLQSIPPDRYYVESAYQGYIRKRDTLARRSDEERFVLKCIRHAFENGLRLPERELYFLLQEWRLPVLGKGKKIDIIAMDPNSRGLVIIEAKDSRRKLGKRDREGRNAREQALHYAEVVFDNRKSLYPFFQRLAGAMSAIYYGPEVLCNITLEPDHIPRTEVWVPEDFKQG